MLNFLDYLRFKLDDKQKSSKLTDISGGQCLTINVCG